MYELIKLSENDYYIDCPSKIGLVKVSENEVVAIDSGNHKDTGKKVLRIINENGWTLKAVFNTHSHADHIGGNKFLQDRTACKIYANGIECDFTNHTVLEPVSLCGGYPMDDLTHKFLKAEESNALPFTKECLPEGMEAVEFKGHSFDMLGFKTKDGNFFIGDALASKETLQKYGITYVFDVKSYLLSLESLKSIPAKHFIPSHSEVTNDIKELADYNIKNTYETAEKIISLLETPICFDELLKRVFDSFSLTLSVEQYALIGSTVRSYLSWLKSENKVGYIIKDNLLLWHKIQQV